MPFLTPETNQFTFLCTGKKLYCHAQIIGLSPYHLEDGDHSFSYGYDGGYTDQGEGRLTPEERTELADYMIDLWTKFKSQ